jgi:DNA repair exonuclease SbcCD nuclease subunit
MLEDQNKELISEIDRLSNLDTRKALDEQIEARNKLDTENLELKQEVKRLSTLINEYVGSNDKLEQKIKDNEDVIKVLSEELDSKDEEYKKERNNNVKFFQKLCTYDNIIKKQRNQLEAYKSLIDEQLKTINTLTETNLALTTGLLNKESIEK